MRCIFFCVWIFCLLRSAFTFSAAQPTDQDTVEMHRLRHASQSRSSVSRISNYSEIPLYSEDRIPILKMTRETLLQFLQDETRFPLIQKAKVEAKVEEVATNIISPGDEAMVQPAQAVATLPTISEVQTLLTRVEIGKDVQEMMEVLYTNSILPEGEAAVQLAQAVEEWSIQPEVEALLRLLVTDDDAQEMMDSFHLFYYDAKFFEQIALEEEKKENRAYNRERKHPQRIFWSLPIFMVVLAICTTIYWLTINKDNPDAMLGFYIMGGALSSLYLGVLGFLSYCAVREDNAEFAIVQAMRTREQAVQEEQAAAEELLEFTEETRLLVTSEEDEVIACLQGKSRTLRSCLLNRKFHTQVKALLERHGLHIVDQIFSLIQEVRIDMQATELQDIATL